MKNETDKLNYILVYICGMCYDKEKGAKTMLVKNIMIPEKNLSKVSLNDTVQETIALIDSHSLLSLPVVDNKKFVGIISKKYIFEEYFNVGGDKDEFLQRKVEEFMKTKVESIKENDLIEIPVEVLAEKNLQFIPVANDKDEFVGIVTHKAVFKTFTNILGFGHTRIVVTTHDMKGRLAKLAETINKHNGNIISIVEVDLEVMNLREIILRVDVEDTKKLITALNTNGFTVRHVEEVK